MLMSGEVNAISPIFHEIKFRNCRTGSSGFMNKIRRPVCIRAQPSCTSYALRGYEGINNTSFFFQVNLFGLIIRFSRFRYVLIFAKVFIAIPCILITCFVSSSENYNNPFFLLDSCGWECKLIFQFYSKV